MKALGILLSSLFPQNGGYEPIEDAAVTHYYYANAHEWISYFIFSSSVSAVVSSFSINREQSNEGSQQNLKVKEGKALTYCNC